MVTILIVHKGTTHNTTPPAASRRTSWLGGASSKERMVVLLLRKSQSSVERTSDGKLKVEKEKIIFAFSKSKSGGDYDSRFKKLFTYTGYLGMGGHGIVMRVRRNSDGQEFALKRIRTTDNPRRIARCEREVRVLRSLEHPQFLEYIDSWGERPPKNWQENEDKKMLPEEHFECIAKAGIFKKPGNIFFSRGIWEEDGRIIIGDMGLATVPNSKKAELKGLFGKPDDFATNARGTYVYQAPEQRFGDDIDEKVDVFAFGLICAELLKPFPSHRVRNQFFERIRRNGDDLFEKDRNAERFIKWCTNKDPEDRPSFEQIVASTYLADVAL
ncbi:unnamed protein product [Caenorhabditis auriculariae]|uniref:Protein kinase domain-containing protein n=1 Tax=Caenorhabditis auriculariae TaxID=2777116 RepID=A0A8S1H6Z3_9PELO|nr:unnamed protein product [Caenorhabditis auriculariae]